MGIRRVRLRSAFESPLAVATAIAPTKAFRSVTRADLGVIAYKAVLTSVDRRSPSRW
jgi:hypothetical protein